MTGRGRPFRTWVNARRMASGTDVGQDHLLHRLRDVLIVQEGVEIRRNVGDATGIASREDHDGRGIAVGLRHATEGVLGSRTVLHGEDADLLAGGHPAHCIGHVQPRALLPNDDGPDIGLGGRLDDAVHRITNEELHPFTLQDLRHRCWNLHEVPPFWDSCSFKTRRRILPDGFLGMASTNSTSRTVL